MRVLYYAYLTEKRQHATKRDKTTLLFSALMVL